MISKESRLVLEAQIDYVLRDMIEHGSDGILVTEGRVDYTNTSLYKFFVTPYKDVFKAVRLSLMDIGNSVRLILSSLFASLVNSKKWMIGAKINFNERRQEINKEWQPILERARDAFGGTDPIFRMALLGPSAFFTIEGLGLGLLAGKTAAEALTGTGWEKLVDNFKTNLTGEETLNKLRRRQQEDNRQDDEFKKEAIEKLSKLEQLFFGKILTYNTEMSRNKNESKESQNLLIAEKKKDENMKISPEDAVKIWADGTGISSNLETAAIKIAKEISSFETMREKVLKRMSLMLDAAAAESFQKFLEIIKKINQSGGKIDTAQFEAEFKKNADAMLKEKLKLASQSQKDKKVSVSSNQQDQSENIDTNKERLKIEQALWQSMKVKAANEIFESFTEKDKDGKFIYDSSIVLEQKDLELMKKYKDVEVKNAAEIYASNQKLYNDIKEKANRLFKSSPARE